MNNNNASWVNGEDLKYEYTYFSKDMIAGKETLFCDKTILSESVINVILWYQHNIFWSQVPNILVKLFYRFNKENGA